MNRKFLTLSMAVLAIFLVGCGGGDVAEVQPAEELILVDMQDIYFGPSNDNVENPPIWEVSSGAEVTLRMENMGALEHSWAILKQGEAIPPVYDEAQDSEKILFSSGNVAAGNDGEVRFTAPSPGEYNVLCTVPGHGVVMQGKLIVTG